MSLSIKLFVFFILILSQTLYSQETNSDILHENTTLSFNGKFVYYSNKNSKVCSKNGLYWCTYDISSVTDETRKLVNFKFYKQNNLLFELETMPGQDLYISNSGYIAFIDHSFHFNQTITINFYSNKGNPILQKEFKGAGDFLFSNSGKLFGVSADKFLCIIDLSAISTHYLTSSYRFDISENDKIITILSNNIINVFKNFQLSHSFKAIVDYPRKMSISPDNKLVSLIGKKELLCFDLSSGKPVFFDQLPTNYSFRDLIWNNNSLMAGVHYRDDMFSKGILKTFDINGNVLHNSEQDIRFLPKPAVHSKDNKSTLDYEQVEWPFVPFNTMHTVWNYYEQHMGSSPSFTYLHQGLDIITPINEPTYAVKGGFVKCVLTLGGSSYWRMAISDEQVPGYSNGWLYAHLVESTIQFDAGDVVNLHDYLGDIIEWSDDWGHIHFVEIRDSGTVWAYEDNEWGINFNPLLALNPDTDNNPPMFDTVFTGQKFAFPINETDTYLEPNNLYGEIDIVANIIDIIGLSEWAQPAYKTFYWVTRLPEDVIVFPRTMAHILNHTFSFYESGSFEPYATLIYKRDELLLPIGWMNPDRHYYHILTNSDGDEFLDLAEAALSFNTSNYIDGDYRIYVEAQDAYGNTTVESMDVVFNNGVIPVELLSFDSEIIDNNIKLNWVTSSESNNLGFEIEQSFIENMWKKIGFVSGYGTSTENRSYLFIDNLKRELGIKKLYYRLKQIDFDGNYTYSKFLEIDLKLPLKFSLKSAYPNPFNPITNIEYSIPIETHVLLKIYDSSGQLISTPVNKTLKPGYYKTTFDGSDLSTGTYIYRIIAGEFSESRKFLLLK